MPSNLPPIAKTAERLLVEIEQAVKSFEHFHKFHIGTDLRKQAMEVARLINRAWRDRERQLYWTNELRWAIDELRISLQLGKQLKAFKSFRQFEMLIRLAEGLGKQAGGWKREQQKHLKGQNPTREAAPERAQILSDRVASTGANA